MDLDQCPSGEEMPPASLSNPMRHSPNKNAVTISKRLLYFQAMRSKKKGSGAKFNAFKFYTVDALYTHPWPSLELGRPFLV